MSIQPMNDITATYFKFTLMTPGADVMEQAATNSGIGFSYTSIVYIKTNYCGYQGVDPSEFTQTEIDTLISELESLTGLPVDGAYSQSDVASEG